MTEIQTPLEELGWTLDNDRQKVPSEHAPVNETLKLPNSGQIIVREVDKPGASIKCANPVPIEQ